MSTTPEEEERSKELASQLIADPELFRQCYPEQFEHIKKLNTQAIEKEPMSYVVHLREWREGLTQWYKDATDTGLPPADRHEKLSTLQKSLRTVLFPKQPFPEIVSLSIGRHTPIFQEYLALVETAMAGIASNSTPAPATSTPAEVGPKVETVPATTLNLKRIDTYAKDKHRRILERYDNYVKKGDTMAQAIDKVVHDFRTVYNPDNPANRKKSLRSIIKKYRNNE